MGNKTIIHLSEERQRTLTGNGAREPVGDKPGSPPEIIVLNPGRNVVDTDMYEAVRDHKEPMGKDGRRPDNHFTQLVEAGVIVVHGDQINIVKMSAPEAIRIIKMEVTAEGVEELLGQELGTEKPRKAVVDACENLIKSIRTGEEEKRKKDEEKKANVKEAKGGGNNA
jgi:hypothetical protein